MKILFFGMVKFLALTKRERPRRQLHPAHPASKDVPRIPSIALRADSFSVASRWPAIIVRRVSPQVKPDSDLA
jgi:hypothetical protein